MIVAIDGPAGAGEHRRAAPRGAARLPLPRHGRRSAPRSRGSRAARGSHSTARTSSPARGGEPGRLRRRGTRLHRRLRRHLLDPPAGHRQARPGRRAPPRRPRGDAGVSARSGRRRRRDRGPRHRHGRRPQARVGVYLVADPAVRASRRSSERPGIGADALATDLGSARERDAINMRPAEDAIGKIDTTDRDVVGRGANRTDRSSPPIREPRRRRLGRWPLRRHARPDRRAAPATTASSRCRRAAAWYSRSTTSTGSTRPSSASSRRARSTSSRSRPPVPGWGG